MDMEGLGIDFLTLSAHKLHGPKGVGALYIKKGIEIEPLVHGGGQEGGMRAGTENTVGIVGLGKAAELAEERLTDMNHRVLGTARPPLERPFTPCSGGEAQCSSRAAASQHGERLPSGHPGRIHGACTRPERHIHFIGFSVPFGFSQTVTRLVGHGSYRRTGPLRLAFFSRRRNHVGRHRENFGLYGSGNTGVHEHGEIRCLPVGWDSRSSPRNVTHSVRW